jgi:hypothetical protein
MKKQSPLSFLYFEMRAGDGAIPGFLVTPSVAVGENF